MRESRTGFFRSGSERGAWCHFARTCRRVCGFAPTGRDTTGGGWGVWGGRGEVVGDKRREVKQLFVTGAEQAVAKGREVYVRLAVFSDGSPSCGTSYIYDGTFSGRTKPGVGVTAALLESNGIAVFSEKRLLEASELLLRLLSRLTARS